MSHLRLAEAVAPGLEDRAAIAERLGIQVWEPAGEGRWGSIARAARESLHDRLPPRYATDTWHIPFEWRLQQTLRPGMRILDVGAGALPMLPVELRPPDTEYVGLDIDAAELRKAPPGSYHEAVEGDITKLAPELVGRFDLVLSWLTMEHVKPVPRALANLRAYQRDGGRFLGYLAGAWGAHAVLNRFVPHRAAQVAMARLLGRRPDTVFRAHYDHCTHTALDAIAREHWRRFTVQPGFTGGWYFRFSPALRAPYLAYEEWAYTGGHRDLAPYYILDATA